MKSKFQLLLCSVLLITISCQKQTNINNDTIPCNSSFCGIFKDKTDYTLIDPIYAPVINASVKLKFYDTNRYDIITTDSLGIKPFITYNSNIGRGTYQILNATQIQFNDENTLYADFDWRLMLNGIYNYTYSATTNELTLTKENFEYHFNSCRFCGTDDIYTTATVIDAGVLAADGCDWMLKFNDSTYYHPENLPDSLKINNKDIIILYDFTGEYFNCGLLPLPYKIINLSYAIPR